MKKTSQKTSEDSLKALFSSSFEFGSSDLNVRSKSSPHGVSDSAQRNRKSSDYGFSILTLLSSADSVKFLSFQLRRATVASILLGGCSELL